MRTTEEYHLILRLWDEGENQLQISRRTRIPRGTVRDCIKRFKSVAGLEADESLKPKVPLSLDNLQSAFIEGHQPVFEAYTYLLGLYLGDGYINKEPRTYKLRICLATAYPDIVNGCIAAIETILPQNKVNLVERPENCVDVYCYNSFWPNYFPQHGEGRKHERKIELVEWQQAIVEKYPLQLFKGLYHSDGSRSKNIVKGKDYPRYEFCNHSEDLKQIFCETCDRLGLHWTVATNGRNINIAKRRDVEWLDQHIGPKT